MLSYTKFLYCRVVSVEPLSKRVEVTLRTSSAGSASKSDKDALSNLTVGDVISGRVKRVEPYGLFILVDNTNMVCNWSLPAVMTCIWVVSYDSSYHIITFAHALTHRKFSLYFFTYCNFISCKAIS